MIPVAKETTCFSDREHVLVHGPFCRGKFQLLCVSPPRAAIVRHHPAAAIVLRRPAAAMALPECPPGHRSLEPQDLAVGKNVMSPVFVNNNAAVGVEATGAEKAAVGAVGSAGIASATLAETYCPSETVDADNFLRNEVVGWMSSLEAGGSSLAEAFDVAMTALGKTPEEMAQAFKVKVPWVPCVNFQSIPKVRKQARCTFRCCHIDRARTQLMACSWEMPFGD